MIEDNKNEDLSVKILGYMMTNYKHGASNTKYNIEINQGMNSWNTKRSFNEFSDLHKKVKKVSKSVPKLPRRKLLKKVVKAEDIDKRKENLEIYLQAIIQIPEVRSNQYFINFMELQSSKFSSLTVNDLNLVGYKINKSLPYKDVILAQNDNLLFAITKPTNENFLQKRVNLTKGDPSSAKIKPGMVDVWKMGSGESIDDYEKVWHQNFKNKALCFDWNSELRYLAVGCESGCVVIMKIEEDPAVYNILVDIQLHEKKSSSSKVMKHNNLVGLHICDDRQLLYSVAADKFLKTFDLETKQVVDCKIFFL